MARVPREPARKPHPRLRALALVDVVLALSVWAVLHVLLGSTVAALVGASLTLLRHPRLRRAVTAHPWLALLVALSAWLPAAEWSAVHLPHLPHLDVLSRVRVPDAAAALVWRAVVAVSLLWLVTRRGFWRLVFSTRGKGTR